MNTMGVTGYKAEMGFKVIKVVVRRDSMKNFYCNLYKYVADPLATVRKFPARPINSPLLYPVQTGHKWRVPLWAGKG